MHVLILKLAILYLSIFVILQQTRLYLCGYKKVIVEGTQLSSNKGRNVYLPDFVTCYLISVKGREFLWEYFVVAAVVYITNRFILILWQSHFLFIQQLTNYTKNRKNISKITPNTKDLRPSFIVHLFKKYSTLYSKSCIHYINAFAKKLTMLSNLLILFVL